MTFDAHEHLRDELHLYPLHLQARVKLACERAWRAGREAASEPLVIPPSGELSPDARDLLIAQRDSTDAINAGVESRKAVAAMARAAKKATP